MRAFRFTARCPAGKTAFFDIDVDASPGQQVAAIAAFLERESLMIFVPHAANVDGPTLASMPLDRQLALLRDARGALGMAHLVALPRAPLPEPPLPAISMLRAQVKFQDMERFARQGVMDNKGILAWISQLQQGLYQTMTTLEELAAQYSQV